MSGQSEKEDSTISPKRKNPKGKVSKQMYIV